jgi:hypothetical protein
MGILYQTNLMKISYTRLKMSIKILYKKQNVNYNFQKHLNYGYLPLQYYGD